MADKLSKPLTTDEVKVARDLFFDIYEVVKERMADDASLDDTMKVMKEVCELAHKLRGDGEKFGFYK